MRWKRQEKGPLVLLYHRVGREKSDPQLLGVTPEHFAEHLDVLSEQFETMPLDRLIETARRSEAPRCAVALTFDDGYADNLLAAKPLLDRYRMPATVFVTSGYVGHGRLFWWDELERLLLGPRRLPRMLAIAISGETLSWNLGDDAEHGVDMGSWTILEDDRGPRQQVYRYLQNRLRLLDEPEREQALEQLRTVAGCDGEDASASARPLALEELALLADGGRVAIGAHTVAHTALSALPRARQREEIAGSKAELEAALGCSVSSFSYPYGTLADFDETAVSLVREAGFESACTNIPGRVGPGADPFRIPRILVRDWSGDELAARLSEVTD
jgi:peptidoglycan/xylan/chitin deacetylase (PgdA/CDA1 family)